MGYKAKRFGATKVALGDEYWAELRPISKGEAEEYQGTVADESDRQDAGEAMLVRMIVRWNLDAEDGSILPISRETVRDLSLPDYGALVAAIGAIINPLAEPAAAKK